MIEILAVLGLPLAGAALLAIVGERRIAPRVNVAVSLLTFLAAVALTVRVIVGRAAARRSTASSSSTRSTCSWSR